MYCMKCGKEMTDGARFCPSCGTPIDVLANSGVGDALARMEAPISEEGKAAVRYRSEYDDRKRDIAEAQELIATWKAEVVRLKKRMSTCLTIGGIIAVLLLVLMLSYRFKDGFESGDTVIGCIVMGILCGAIPFGFCPFKDWVQKSGFWFTGGWIIILMLSVLVMSFAMFAGIPYFFILRGKIKEAEQQVQKSIVYEQQCRERLAAM